MILSDKEKEEAAQLSLFILNTTFLKQEKELFYKYIQVLNISDLEYFLDNFSFLYEKNNSIELDTLKFNAQIDTDRDFSEEELQVLFDFFLITPRIVSIYTESLRQIGSLEDVIRLYHSYINNFNKLLDRYFSTISIDDQEIRAIVHDWIIDFKNRIQNIKEQIEYSKKIAEKPKQPTVLEWKGKQTERSRISKKIRSLGFTNKPTDFEKVFTEKKPTEWLGSHYVLAHLIYSLGNKTLENKKIKSSDRSGYMAVASLYFTDCNCVTLSHLKINLNDLSYKVRHSKSEHSDIKAIVDNILSALIQK